MYLECRDYLAAKLRDACGYQRVLTSDKQIRLNRESHFGAVLYASETLRRDGSKTIYKDNRGATVKRRKVFERDIAFDVVIGSEREAEVEECYGRFLAALDKGTYIDGNYVPIEPETAQWLDQDDGLLRAKLAVEVKITFSGGVYRETGFAHLSTLEVESIEKKKGRSENGGENTGPGGESAGE